MSSPPVHRRSSGSLVVLLNSCAPVATSDCRYCCTSLIHVTHQLTKRLAFFKVLPWLYWPYDRWSTKHSKRIVAHLIIAEPVSPGFSLAVIIHSGRQRFGVIELWQRPFATNVAVRWKDRRYCCIALWSDDQSNLCILLIVLLILALWRLVYLVAFRSWKFSRWDTDRNSDTLKNLRLVRDFSLFTVNPSLLFRSGILRSFLLPWHHYVSLSDIITFQAHTSLLLNFLTWTSHISTLRCMLLSESCRRHLLYAPFDTCAVSCDLYAFQLAPSSLFTVSHWFIFELLLE